VARAAMPAYGAELSGDSQKVQSLSLMAAIARVRRGMIGPRCPERLYSPWKKIRARHSGAMESYSQLLRRAIIGSMREARRAGI
jgi:hypothetical protein